jgi:hypothetical protein
VRHNDAVASRGRCNAQPACPRRSWSVERQGFDKSIVAPNPTEGNGEFSLGWSWVFLPTYYGVCVRSSPAQYGCPAIAWGFREAGVSVARKGPPSQVGWLRSRWTAGASPSWLGLPVALTVAANGTIIAAVTTAAVGTCSPATNERATGAPEPLLSRRRLPAPDLRRANTRSADTLLLREMRLRAMLTARGAALGSAARLRLLGDSGCGPFVAGP